MSCFIFSQSEISGYVTNANNNEFVSNVSIYDKSSGLLGTTNSSGFYSFSTDKAEITIVFYSPEYEIFEQRIVATQSQKLNVALQPLQEQLSEIVINARKQKVFELSRLKDVEETAIYAGKKTEVVLVEQSMANLATNNARQLYSRVAGLNIFQNDDAGLQLNIGGRGLDPNRTANFNTRQNGYDISADVLGYPESYYTPAAEGLKEIQVIRGAASLQYGTQFGGLINFKTKEPNRKKEIELITRNTLGSFGLYTNFTSLSGTKGKFSYYTYFNYKTGDGFRPNSEFESKNVFAHLGYKFNEKTNLSAEFTHLYYLAQQAGGLTDAQFNQDAFQSNRARNWFKVNWFLYNLKLSHKFSENTNFTLSAFGLDASRDALGFRTNRVDQIDTGAERDLLRGNFSNYGAEARLLSKYKILGKNSTFLIGSKYYKAENNERQGPGSDGIGADFRFRNDEFPDYPFQSDFDFPNLNVAVFGENIFYITDKFSITPGFRFEYIKTESDGFFTDLNFDGAGNVIFEETVEENRVFERNFILFGLGLSYKSTAELEVYANISQNYRSVTFNDINIVNPAFSVNPNITDEEGFTADLGFRGTINNTISYDVGAFALFYNGRIGLVERPREGGGTVSERANVGDAVIYGIESLVDVSLKKPLQLDNDFVLNYFVNASFIASEYTKSEIAAIEGKRVEFVPEINIKTGLRFGYKNLLANIQYTYLGEQFSDATNAGFGDISGVLGPIPQYDVLDISLSYTYKRLKLETGINNVLNNTYFTRRATGYPGPGIIPSAPRNWFTTLQISF